MHLEEETIPGSVSWQSSLEAAKKLFFGKQGKASCRATRKSTTKSRIKEMADNEGYSDSFIENSTFRVDSEYFNGGNNVSHVICVNLW